VWVGRTGRERGHLGEEVVARVEKRHHGHGNASCKGREEGGGAGGHLGEEVVSGV